MVDGVARAKKATRTTGKRPRRGQQLQQGGIIDTELFIDISNVQLVCKSCGKPTRVGHRDRGRREGAGLPQVRGGDLVSAMADDYTPRLKQRFRDELVPQLQKELGYGNVMQVPAPGEGRREHGRR